MIRNRRAFSIVELLVVISVIAVLLALLLAGLAAVRGTGERVQSLNNMRSIGTWMKQYSMENKSFIVPSKFDYNGAPYEGKVKSESPIQFDLHRGTWTDILWTLYQGTSFPQAVDTLQHDYKFDSPDNKLYDLVPDYYENPFRSTVIATRGNVRSKPGYFAANNFFNADSNDNVNPAKWWTVAQIKHPAESLYAIDSVEAETIDPLPSDTNNGITRYWGRYLTNDPAVFPQVDYRYEGEALVLFLDSSVGSVGEILIEPGDPRTDLEVMEDERRIRVRNLDQRQ